MEICIVQITKVLSKNYCYSIEIMPSKGTVEVITTVASSIPMTQDGGGIFAAPEVSPGIKAIAVRYEFQFIIIGFFSDFMPQLSNRKLATAEEALEDGDINIRSGSGNRVSIFKNGKLDLFSNIWSRIHLSQSKEQIEAYFRKIKIKWFGGSILAQDEETTRIVLSQGFQNATTDDSNLDSDELPNIDPQSTSLDAFNYVNKAIISNENVPLSIETRQNTGGSAAFMGFMKDVFTIEKRGHRDEENVVYEFETIDRSRGTISKQRITEAGLDFLVEQREAIGGLTPSQATPNWQSYYKFGDTVELTFDKDDSSCSIKFLDDELEIKRNEHTIRINNNFSILREGSGEFILSFNEDGTAFINNDQFTLKTNLDGVVEITVPENGKIKLGSSDVDISVSSQGTDNVLTPNSIFGNGVVYDTFTGLPFKGSTVVGVQADSQ